MHFTQFRSSIPLTRTKQSCAGYLFHPVKEEDGPRHSYQLSPGPMMALPTPPLKDSMFAKFYTTSLKRVERKGSFSPLFCPYSYSVRIEMFNPLTPGGSPLTSKILSMAGLGVNGLIN